MIRSDKKGENMNFINLDSVGSTITNEGLVFPQDITEAPTTASEADEMSGVHIMECCDEWWESISCEEGVRLFQFLAETDIYLEKDYFKWAMNQMDKVVEANGFNSVVEATIEEGWSI